MCGEVEEDVFGGAGVIAQVAHAGADAVGVNGVCSEGVPGDGEGETFKGEFCDVS